MAPAWVLVVRRLRLRWVEYELVGATCSALTVTPQTHDRHCTRHQSVRRSAPCNDKNSNLLLLGKDNTLQWRQDWGKMS